MPGWCEAARALPMLNASRIRRPFEFRMVSRSDYPGGGPTRVHLGEGGPHLRGNRQRTVRALASDMWASVIRRAVAEWASRYLCRPLVGVPFALSPHIRQVLLSFFGWLRIEGYGPDVSLPGLVRVCACS